MCWGAGQLLAAGVVRALAGVQGDMAWRLGFVLQWVWPIPLFIGAYLAPESPWNAVRRNKIDLARKSMMRLRQDTPDKEREVEAAVAYIRYTTALEVAETEDATFMECFRGTNLRRTEIVSLPSHDYQWPALMLGRRTALSGPHKSSAEMPFSTTQSSFSRPLDSQNSKRLTLIFPLRVCAPSMSICAISQAHFPVHY